MVGFLTWAMCFAHTGTAFGREAGGASQPFADYAADCTASPRDTASGRQAGGASQPFAGFAADCTASP